MSDGHEQPREYPCESFSSPDRSRHGARVFSPRNDRIGGRFADESMFDTDQEEDLVVDDRAALRPAQVVEIKLTRLVQEASLPVSHLQMRPLLRTR